MKELIKMAVVSFVLGCLILWGLCVASGANLSDEEYARKFPQNAHNEKLFENPQEVKN